MIREVFARSEVLAEMLASGEIDIIGAMYDIETGKVEFAERSALSSSR